jgi:hypothetical protein
MRLNLSFWNIIQPIKKQSWKLLSEVLLLFFLFSFSTAEKRNAWIAFIFISGLNNILYNLKKYVNDEIQNGSDDGVWQTGLLFVLDFVHRPVL